MIQFDDDLEPMQEDNGPQIIETVIVPMIDLGSYNGGVEDAFLRSCTRIMNSSTLFYIKSEE